MPLAAIDPALRPLLFSGSAIVALGIIYFVLRFRLSRGTNRGAISTPALDRRNREALEHMGRGERLPGDGAAPADLVKAVEEAKGATHRNDGAKE